jgi:hypothetical protein
VSAKLRPFRPTASRRRAAIAAMIRSKGQPEVLFDEVYSPPSGDASLDAVFDALQALDPTGQLMASVLRATFDQLYDGQHTGRYKWDQLYKTEKTHFGTLVEINLQRRFKYADGLKLDYQIAGVDVDCKYSQKKFSWMLPPEAVGHLCLVLTADDTLSLWSAGLVRASEEHLSDGANRDGKKTLNLAGRKSIRWLAHDAALPENLLLQLPPADVDIIFANKRSGQKRINELLRRSQGRLVRRGVVATVAQQEDYMKRLRQNGGARETLWPEGILVLGGNFNDDRRLADSLGVPVPGKGEVVSVRVVRAEATWEGASVALGGSRWRVARPDDAASEGPQLRIQTRASHSANLTRPALESNIEQMFDAKEGS